MSRVFLAEEIRLKRRVVIKVLPREMVAAFNADRFQREIELAAQLQHPHIVPLLTTDTANGMLYYTMPFVTGESLRNRLAREGPLPLADALPIWRDLLDALAHAHASGVIHCDIKPGNILLSGRNALVSDFGIALALETAGGQTHATTPRLAIGSPAYMAPEQMGGGRTLDHRVDLYATGVVMYETLMGHPPFTPGSTRELLETLGTREPRPLNKSVVPEKLAALVLSCLAQDPAARPQSAEAMLEALEASVTSVAAAPDRTVESVAAQRLRQVGRYAIALFALLAVMFAVTRLTRHDMLPAGGGRPAARQYTTSEAADEWYRRAIDRSLMRTSAGRRKAIEYFNRAIAADSNFAAAHAGLAMEYARGSKLISQAERAAQKALALDDSLADAHSALGWVRLIQRQYGEAEAKLNRAVALDPQARFAFEGLARTYMVTGRPAEQLEAALKGLDIEPYSHSAIREWALALSMNRRCEEALDRLDRLKRLDPPASVAGIIRGECYAEKEMWPEAIAEFRWALALDINEGAALGMLGYALARAGQTDSAKSILEDLLAGRRKSLGAFGIGVVQAGLGELNDAFASLEKAADEGTWRQDIMCPMFDELRRDPRYERVKRRLNL